MKKTVIEAEFCISGRDFDANLVTKNLGIQPTDIRTNGISDAEWLLKTVHQVSSDINVDQLIKPFQGKESLLRDIKENKSIKFYFDIRIKIYDNEIPKIRFTSKTIQLIKLIHIDNLQIYLCDLDD